MPIGRCGGSKHKASRSRSHSQQWHIPHPHVEVGRSQRLRRVEQEEAEELERLERAQALVGDVVPERKLGEWREVSWAGESGGRAHLLLKCAATLGGSRRTQRRLSPVAPSAARRCDVVRVEQSLLPAMS